MPCIAPCSFCFYLFLHQFQGYPSQFRQPGFEDLSSRFILLLLRSSQILKALFPVKSKGELSLIRSGNHAEIPSALFFAWLPHTLQRTEWPFDFFPAPQCVFYLVADGIEDQYCHPARHREASQPANDVTGYQGLRPLSYRYSSNFMPMVFVC
jgi:hypothetical protein